MNNKNKFKDQQARPQYMNHFPSIHSQTDKTNVNRTKINATQTSLELTVMNNTRGLHFLPLEHSEVRDRGKDGQRIFRNKVEAINKTLELMFYSSINRLL